MSFIFIILINKNNDQNLFKVMHVILTINLLGNLQMLHLL